jgi:hypothetical protein
MKQTAVEWLVETLNKKYGNDDFIITFINEIEQAKEIEKQQIENAFDDGWKRADDTRDIPYSTAEDFGNNYYNKTFNK